MARTIAITEREAIDQVVEDGAWIDSELFEALLRDACADAALLQELDELLPDTIEQL